MLEMLPSMTDGWGIALLCSSLLWAMLLPVALFAAFMIGRFSRRVERDGLVGCLPGGAERTLDEPLFNLLRSAFDVLSQVACNIIRLAMLVCLDLDRDQQIEVLEGLDPKFRHCVFQEPLVELLPWPARRLLFGRAAAGGRRRDADSAGAPPSASPERRNTCASIVARQSPRNAGDLPPQRSQSSPEMPRTPSLTPEEIGQVLQRTQAVGDSLLEVVRGCELGLSRDNGNRRDSVKATVFTFERILTQKAAGSALSVVNSLAHTAQSVASDGFSYSSQKVSQLRAGVRDLAADPKARATAVSAAGGAATLGVTGGVAGFVSGGLCGAAAGVVPAFFTFGLSIPIGAALGASTGLCAGTAVGGSTGLICGGAAGYHMHRQPADGKPALGDDDLSRQSSDLCSTASSGSASR